MDEKRRIATDLSGLQDLIAKSWDVLELPAVLAEVGKFAASVPGRRKVESTLPEVDPILIGRNLDLVAQLKEETSVSGPIGPSDLPPLDGLLRSLDNPAMVLDSEALIAIEGMLETTEIVLRRLRSLPERFDLLAEMAEGLRPVENLRKHISRVFDRNGMVRSTASPQLAKIRERAARTRGRIRSSLEAVIKDRGLSRIVQEDYITIRNDRCVVLLRPEFKGLLEGIVHDRSRSGASVYVEPLGVVDLNNQAASLMDEERGEIHRIFRELTEEVRDSLEELWGNYDSLAGLDALQARASYAEKTSGTVPTLVPDGFRILGARHPLLHAEADSKVVPMDVIQDAETKATVISGANMGGKTVALKIAGLMPLMVRCGIMIPAGEGSEIQPFPRIMADIGDDQDIRGKISSFSGHAMTIKSILDQAGEGDLVLLDELGGATDPDEGSALAMAVMDEIVECGSRVVVTTHLTQLKAHAMGKDCVKNVSVEFHPGTLQPTYRLLYDLPGESHAIATAERIGLSERVIQRSRRYMDKATGGTSDLMIRLRENLDQLERKSREVDEQRQVLDSRLAEIESERDALIEEYRKKAAEAIRNAERQIGSLQKSIKSGRMKDAGKSVRIMAEIKDQVSRELGTPLDKPPTRLAVGTRVMVRSIGKEGLVTAELERGRVEIALGNVRTRADTDDLDPIGYPEEKSALKNDRIKVDIPITTARREVNVIGLRVDEALPVVDRAVDDAILGGLSSLSIIHGMGTGRLKKAIRDHLDGHSWVRSVQTAGYHEGKEGVTIVELVSD